jgi:tetratricopeptide (TPR) repeat protein
VLRVEIECAWVVCLSEGIRIRLFAWDTSWILACVRSGGKEGALSSSGAALGHNLIRQISLLLAFVLLTTAQHLGDDALARAAAAYRNGDTAEAKRMLGNIMAEHPSELGAFVLMGAVLDSEQRYQDAESYFNRALKMAPTSAQVLNNFGNHYLAAGDRTQARKMYEKAVASDTHELNANLQLAQMSVEDRQGKSALTYLDRVSSAAGLEPDVLLLRARALAISGRCVEANGILEKLGPSNQAPLQFSAGMTLAECKLYSAAEESFSRALAGDPQNFDILYNLGLAALRSGDGERAEGVLEIALKDRPADPDVLFALAQVLLKNNARLGESLALLAKARKAAPERADIALLQARVLRQLNQVREHGQDLLMDRYLGSLREKSAAEPDNARLKVTLARELLTQGDKTEALAIFEHLPPSALDPSLTAECGRILLDFELYEKAAPYLEQALAATPNAGAVRIDLALTLFNSRGADAALAELDRTSVTDRNGDYYLLRAEILDAQGRIPEAAAALNQGMRSAPARASLYYEAAGFLLKHQLYLEANTLLTQASQILPDDRELQLAHAVTLHMLRRDPEANDLLEKVRTRWPEWARVYLLKGILLEIDLKSGAARQSLETAIALGADTPEAYYYQALAITHVIPEDLNAANDAIGHALAHSSQDPYIYLLAGKILLERKEYPAAIERLLQAVHLDPKLIPAHYALRHAYSDLGEEDKSVAEVETIKRLAKDGSESDESPFSAQDFLFAVRRPE